MVSGLGVATADAIYGGIAAFGVTALSDVMVGQARLLGMVGGVALIVIGIRTLRTDPTAAPATETAPATDIASAAEAPAMGRSLAAAYGSILGLTLTNPLTIVSFAVLFAGFGVAGSVGGAALLTAGVFAGSALWWLVLVSVAAALRTRITPRALRWVNVGAGAAIAAFGVLAVVAGVAAG